MSTIAVFLVVGGATAFAAHHLGKGSVGAKQLKKNAVTTAKIKKRAVTAAKIKKGAIRGGLVADGSLTGADINAATLGTVPNAAAVNGQTATKIYKTFHAGENGVVAGIAGFTLGATCEKENIDVTLTSPTSANSVEMAQGSGNEHLVFEYDAASGGTPAVIRLDGSEENENHFGESTISAATSAGAVISGDIGYDFGTFNDNPPDTCIVFGEILSG
jgi:hypothetical protein